MPMDITKAIREWGRPDPRERYYAVAPNGHLVSLDPNDQGLDGFKLAERADLELAVKAALDAGLVPDIKVEHALRSLPPVEVAPHEQADPEPPPDPPAKVAA